MSKFQIIQPLTVLIFFLWSFSAQAQSKTNSLEASYRLSGDVKLLSHFIDKGLSFSDNNPAMNASFLANFGAQVRMGFWGSNISNVGAVDDNFWFKFLGEVSVDFSQNLNSVFYVSDNHFYKSNTRNGQIVGVNTKYKSSEFLFEWLGNFEGTKTNAEYLRYGYFMTYKKDFRYGGYAGYTNSHTAALKSYFDLRALGQYQFDYNSNVEAGLTFNSNKSQFGRRGEVAYYLALQLTY
jgi:hypothetical protein